MSSIHQLNSQHPPGSYGSEEVFRTASDQLYRIFSNAALDNEQKLSSMLDLSLDYFGLDTAIISSITGSSSLIVVINSIGQEVLEAGVSLPLDKTPDSESILVDGHSANPNCEPGRYEYRSNSNRIDVGSYIATSLHTVNGPYGSVSFSSVNSRAKNFEEYDRKYLSLVANWLGYFLGNAEQIEFMEKQNEHYKTLFESIPTVMFLCDSDGLIISASQQFADTIGVELDMVPGNICSRYFDEHGNDAVRTAIAQGHAVQLPAMLLQTDKSSLEVEINISVKPIGTMRNIRMVIATDVSARNAALRETKDQNRLLEKANEGLNQFAFVASHDLQEPLRKIQQFSSFLEEDLVDQLDGDSKYHLDVIVKSSQRMSLLIKDLLALSKTSSVDPDMEPVSLNQLLESIENEIQPLLNEVGAVVEIGELPNVKGNVRLLGQLFTNLIFNGIKYRSENRSPKLHIDVKEENGHSHICVRDNGIGFDMENAQKIFEPFHRLHRAKDYEGTGIGLAICSAVCEKHGWSLSASSVLGEGSVFSINLENE